MKLDEYAVLDAVLSEMMTDLKDLTIAFFENKKVSDVEKYDPLSQFWDIKEERIKLMKEYKASQIEDDDDY